MCGIAGIIDAEPIAADDVRRMGEALAHRGPDDAAVHVEPGVGFAFRRLAIIDLVTGDQPIPNEDESVRVMLNGEIYNYRELRDGLISRGHEFRSRSDTEVLAHLYEEKGDELVHDLRGMFAFAIWDRRRRRVLIARDHLGQKPLYWARTGRGRVFFASEIKAILAAAPEFRRMDPVGLHDYLTLRVIPDPRSMFEGVHKLPPGHVLVAEGGEVVTRRYWNLDFEPKRRISMADAVEELDHEVRQAVRLHLVSDVPVGAFLSGGLDSGLITAIIREISGEPFDTFSVGVPYDRYDEASAARRVANRFGTVHHEESITGDVVQLLPDVVFHLDEPSDPLSVCMYHLARMTRRTVKVAVGGDGGDELFGGYDRYYGTRYVRYYAALPAALRRSVLKPLIERAPDGFWYKSLSNRLRWMHELAEVDGGRRYARALSYFYFTPAYRQGLYTDRFRSMVDRHDAEQAIIRWHDEGATHSLDRMLSADSMVRLPNHPVMILDRTTMAHGLEARSPFMDHRLAEFAARLPPRLKVRGTKRRRIQVRLAERYLPNDIVNRPKQGFTSGLPYLLDRQFRDLHARFLERSYLVEAGYWRREPVERMLRAHLAGSTDHGNRLWLLLNAELWYRLHIEGEGRDQIRGEMAEAIGISRAPRVAAAS